MNLEKSVVEKYEIDVKYTPLHAWGGRDLLEPSLARARRLGSAREPSRPNNILSRAEPSSSLKLTSSSRARAADSIAKSSSFLVI